MQKNSQLHHEKFKYEIQLALQARLEKNHKKEWNHLERAHILGQFNPWKHFWVHLLMMRFSLVNLKLLEFLGQIPRIILAIPGSVTGLAPKGNTGGSSVGMFTPMDIPQDLHDFVG